MNPHRDDKIARLKAFLRQAPASMCVQLAEAAGVFAMVSPLLSDATSRSEGGARAFGRIDRRALAAVWRWLADDLAPNAAIDAVGGWTARAVGLTGEDAAPAIARLQREGASAIRRAFAEAAPEDRQLIEAELGGPRLAADVQDIATLWSAAGQIAALLKDWPARERSLPEGVGRAARKLFEARAEDAPELGPLVAALFLTRVDAPGSVLEFAWLAREEAGPAAADGYDALLERVLREAGGVTRGVVEAALANADEALARLDRRAEALDKLAHALSGFRCPPWRARVEAAQAEAAGDFAAICARASQGLRAAFPYDLWTLGPQADSLTPQVLQGARFVREAGRSASKLGFEGERRFAAAEIEARLSRQQINATVAAARVGPAAAREHARKRLGALASLMEAYGEASEAAALRKRVADLSPDAEMMGWYFEPVELLVAPPRGDGRVHPRAVTSQTLERLWARLRELAGDEMQDGLEDIDAFTCMGDVARTRGAAQALRAKTVPLLAQALETGERRDLEKAFGGEDGLAAAGDVVTVLANAEAVDAVFAHWPATVRDLDEALAQELRAAYEALCEQAPEAAPLMLVVAMKRLARPAQILRAVKLIARQSNEAMVADTDCGMVGDRLLDEAEAVTPRLAPPKGRRFDADAALRALDAFAGVVAGMTEEFDLDRNGPWGKRLFALRSESALVLEDLCRRAVAAVEEVTPRRTDPRTKHGAPNIDRRPGEDAVREAIDYVRFLKRSAINDERAAFASARAQALAQVVERIHAHADMLVGFAREGAAKAPGRWLKAHVNATARLVEAVDGGDAAAILRRRAAAAA